MARKHSVTFASRGRPVTVHPGERFGMLTVIERAANVRGKVMFVCRCDCGEVKVVSADSLRTGKTRSCGCLRREMMRAASRQAREISEFLAGQPVEPPKKGKE